MKMLIETIGVIRSERKEAIDDHWDSVKSWLELEPHVPAESITGLESFSHVEILYYFHEVDKENIILKAEHPRENSAWPRVGIYAQRKRARPNLIGTTISKLVKIEGKRIYLAHLDAIDGSPVIDIKPVFRQFLPAGEVIQPAWVDEMMGKYW